VRIAILAPLYQRVPPDQYGGTERVVSYLTEELVRRGHAVTLYASEGSQTRARLMPMCPEPLDLAGRLTDPVAYHILQIGLVLDDATSYDVIHSHCDFRAVPFVHRSPVPILSTNHNRLDSPENRCIVERYPDAPLTALSRSHQRQLPGARWLGVCPNGIPADEFPFSATPGDYLAFVGRMSPEKGPLAAIEVAERTGLPLKLVAKVNDWEREYFDVEVKPRLRPPAIEYLGELDEGAKRDLLLGALTLLFPITWDEPFGMVMIEAMAVGTPVLAFRHGAVSEVVDEGITGYVCSDVASMAELVGQVASLDRTRCREQVRRRFSAAAMADKYEQTYARLVNQETFA
jgi:glycosyltransferase involved in cell wall biosynthesis